MEGAFPGLGTVINVATVVIGSLLGMAVGHRLSDRTRSVVTDCLGLTTLLMAGLSVAKVTDASLLSAVGSGAVWRVWPAPSRPDSPAARSWWGRRRPARATRPGNASSRDGSAPHCCS